MKETLIPDYNDLQKLEALEQFIVLALAAE